MKSIRASLLIGFCLLTAALLSLSPQVFHWWVTVGHNTHRGPEPVRWMLGHRPSLGEADAHLLMWFTISVCIATGVTGRWERRIAWAAAVVMGLLIEVTQELFTDSRSASVGDVIGNLTGLVAGAVVVQLARRMLSWRHIDNGSPHAT